MSKEEPAIAATSDKVINKVIPNEFDPLQDKEKKIEEIKKDQISHGDVANKDSTTVPPQALPTAKTSNNQINEYYGATPVYGLYLSVQNCESKINFDIIAVYPDAPYASYPRQHFNYTPTG